MLKGYQAFILTESGRADLIQRYPALHPEVVAHHVTHAFGVSVEDEVPDVWEVEVVGHTSNYGIQALVVKVNGSTERPDGGTYHITLSLDRGKGYAPKHSNDLVAKGYGDIIPFTINVTPSFIPFGRK